MQLSTSTVILQMTDRSVKVAVGLRVNRSAEVRIRAGTQSTPKLAARDMSRGKLGLPRGFLLRYGLICQALHSHFRMFY